ncbi:hypothetical protein RZS08_61330, partial [Arthrospira platensis SPKY1]|nr:hypothetical protein [Arthrospira platensis SPKY1]
MVHVPHATFGQGRQVAYTLRGFPPQVPPPIKGLAGSSQIPESGKGQPAVVCTFRLIRMPKKGQA